MKNQNGQNAQRLSILLALIILSQNALAASTSGVDTPAGVTSLPLSVQGVTGLALSANPIDPTQPPTVAFTGPLTEGSTTINTDGSMMVGSNAATQPSPVLTVNGTVSISNTLDVSSGTIDFSNSSTVGYGVLADDGWLHLSADSTSGQAIALSAPNGIYIRPTYNGTVVSYLSTTGGSSYINATGGAVGIGTTGPGGTLDVENSSGTASLCLNGACESNLMPKIQQVSKDCGGTASTCIVSCPSATTVTGGGCFVGSLMAPSSSYPNGNGWYCSTQNWNSSGDLGAYAICLSLQ